MSDEIRFTDGSTEFTKPDGSTVLARAFKNEHLSVSRLKLYEQCELSFYFRYVSKGDIAPRGNAADFGVVLHAALELMYTWIVANEYEGTFPTAELVEFYKQAWQASSLVGVALYQEGLQILRAYAARHRTVDHMTILGVEVEFNIDVGGFTVNGYIDRVDKLGDDHILIADYKSNRALFSKEELETDLQMSVYGLAARKLWPWAKRVSFAFDMLRHDMMQKADRTAEIIDDAAGYVISLGKRSEQPRKEDEWKPQLNGNCSYCDSRMRCPLYTKILAGGHEVTKVANTEDFGEVAATREKLAKLAKVLYARKGELDDLIKAKLAKEGEFEAGGFRYRYISGGSSKVYSPGGVMRAFAKAGVSSADVAKSVLVVDNAALTRFYDEKAKTLPEDAAIILEATLAGIADAVPNAQRLDSREIKTAKKVKEDDLAKEAKEVDKIAKKAAGNNVAKA